MPTGAARVIARVLGCVMTEAERGLGNSLQCARPTTTMLSAKRPGSQLPLEPGKRMHTPAAEPSFPSPVTQNKPSQPSQPPLLPAPAEPCPPQHQPPLLPPQCAQEVGSELGPAHVEATGAPGASAEPAHELEQSDGPSGLTTQEFACKMQQLESRLNDWMHAFVSGVTRDAQELAYSKIVPHIQELQSKIMTSAQGADTMRGWNQMSISHFEPRELASRTAATAGGEGRLAPVEPEPATTSAPANAPPLRPVDPPPAGSAVAAEQITFDPVEAEAEALTMAGHHGSAPPQGVDSGAAVSHGLDGAGLESGVLVAAAAPLIAAPPLVAGAGADAGAGTEDEPEGHMPGGLLLPLGGYQGDRLGANGQEEENDEEEEPLMPRAELGGGRERAMGGSMFDSQTPSPDLTPALIAFSENSPAQPLMLNFPSGASAAASAPGLPLPRQHSRLGPKGVELGPHLSHAPGIGPAGVIGRPVTRARAP